MAKVVFEFNNFETLINSKIKQLSDEIFVKKANVAIDNFESSGKTLKDLEQISPKYIKFKLEDMEENTKQYLQELSTFCLLNSINLIVFGINTKEMLDFVEECNIRYVQGAYFGKPTDGLDISNSLIEEKLDNEREELIV